MWIRSMHLRRGVTSLPKGLNFGKGVSHKCKCSRSRWPGAAAAKLCPSVDYTYFEFQTERHPPFFRKRSVRGVLVGQSSLLQSPEKYQWQLYSKVRFFQLEAGDEFEEDEVKNKESMIKLPVCSGAIPLETRIPLHVRIRNSKRKKVLQVILDWIAEGNTLQRIDIMGSIHKFKRHKYFKQALEVTEWLLEEQPFELVESDYALLPYFTGKVHGPQRAEEVLSQIPSEFKRSLVYCSLLEIYAENDYLKDAIHTLKKIQALGARIHPFSYNLLISMFHRNAHDNDIPLLLRDMEKRCVAYNASTYNILIMIEAENYNIDGMEKAFEKMKADSTVKTNCVTYATLAFSYLSAGLLEKAEAAIREIEQFGLRSMKYTTIDQLMVLYGSLGKLNEVERVYQKAKKLFAFPALHTYVSAIEAFGEAGSVQRAEEVVQEMVTKRGWCRVMQYNAILGVYTRRGLMEEAEKIVKNLLASNHKPNSITYRQLLEGYLRAGQMEKAKKLINRVEKFKITKKDAYPRHWLQSTLNIVDLFAEKGNVEHAELFFQDLKAARHSRYFKAYNILLKAYVKAQQPADEFLSRMREDQVTPDAETYALLEQLVKSNSI